MTYQDLEKFIEKVDSLKKLVVSLDQIPQRKERLARCVSHDEVVKLAKEWGYDIGRRWGDHD